MTDATTEQEEEVFSAKLEPPKGDHRYTRRRRIHIDADKNPVSEGCHVSLNIMEGWGHPSIYCELTPDEARTLAEYLRQAAAWADERF